MKKSDLDKIKHRVRKYTKFINSWIRDGDSWKHSDGKSYYSYTDDEKYEMNDHYLNRLGKEIIKFVEQSTVSDL